MLLWYLWCHSCSLGLGSYHQYLHKEINVYPYASHSLFFLKKPQPDKFGNYLVNVALHLADNKTRLPPPRSSWKFTNYQLKTKEHNSFMPLILFKTDTDNKKPLTNILVSLSQWFGGGKVHAP